MTIELLRTMLQDGTFHHATYRDYGKVWEGLYIYKRDPDGFNGYSLAGSFNNYYRAYEGGNPECIAAEQLLREARRAVSVGAYGKG